MPSYHWYNMRKPDALATSLYWLSLGASMALGLSLGLQFMLALIISWGPTLIDSWPAPETLTTMGQVYVHPENDVRAYVLGCAVTVLLTALLTLHWNRVLHGHGVDFRRRAYWGAGFHALLASASLTVFLVAIAVVQRRVDGDWRCGPVETLLLFSVPLGTALVTAVYHGLEQPVRRLLESGISQSRIPVWCFDLGIVTGTILVIYVPHVEYLAGAIYANEAFFHWDHFLLAPASAFIHGKAFGADFYSQYGVGYPLFFALLHPFRPLTHTFALHAAVVYACFYYLALYWLLRKVTGSVWFAAGGLFLALFTTTFAPAWSEAKLAAVWQWPSSSILRAPFDVLFFLCLWQHSRHDGPWAVWAGLLAGLGLLAETDTGLCLAAVLVFYWFMLYMTQRLGDESSMFPWPSLWGSLVVMVGVWLAGLTLASRGALVMHPIAFWPGWFSGIANSSELGIGALVFLSRVGLFDITLFILIAGLFLGAFCTGLLRLAHDSLTAHALLTATVAFYGLGRGLIFVWRTLEGNLAHMGIALAIVVSLALHAAHRRTRPPVGQYTSPVTGLVTAAFPMMFCAATAIALIASPTFREYPGLLRHLLRGAPEQGVCLLDDGRICGLPEEYAGEAREVREALASMRDLRQSGHEIAILDDRNTLYYLEGGIPTWSAEPTLFLNTFTQEQLKNLCDDLRQDRPEFVYIRSESPGEYYVDTWSALRATVEAHYARAGAAGPFEIWRAEE